MLVTLSLVLIIQGQATKKLFLEERCINDRTSGICLVDFPQNLQDNITTVLYIQTRHGCNPTNPYLLSPHYLSN